MKNTLFPGSVFAALLLILGFSAQAAESSLPPYCTGSTIASVSASLDPKNPNAPSFPYRYQLLQAADPSAPTIIVIPGGPGGVSIRDWSQTDDDTKTAFARYGFPAGYSYLFTDPRSVGCNLGDTTAFPDDGLSTENLAQDIIAVIQARKLTNYYLYGHSYGSQVATVLASLIERQDLTRPKAVILSGVLGRIFHGDDESTVAQLEKQWNRLKPMLPPQALSAMQGDSPLGIPGDTWANFLMWGFYKQSVLVNGQMDYPLRDQLALLGSGNTRDSDRLKTIVLAPATGPAKSPEEKATEARMNSIIACREIADVDYDIHFERGEFLFGAKTDCSPFSLDRPYDAKNWPINQPIFYLSGEFDPAAPPYQAQHHVESETGADRFLITVAEAGHSKIGDLMPDCKEDLWKSFAAEGAGLAAALDTCMAKSKLSHFPKSR